MHILRFNSGRCCIAFIEIGEEFNASCLSDEEKLGLQKRSSEKKRQEFLYGRYIAKIALQQCLSQDNITMQSISVLNDEAGKPYITNDFGYSVSITHSHGIVSVMVFPSIMSYGIDIEFINNKHEKALKRFFKNINDINELTKLWCLKESTYKADIKDNFTPQKNNNFSIFQEIYQLKDIVQKYADTDTATIDIYDISQKAKGFTIQCDSLIFGLVME